MAYSSAGNIGSVAGNIGSVVNDGHAVDEVLPLQKALLAERLCVVRERVELPGCNLHLVDLEGVVLLVVIAVELDRGIQLRCTHGASIEGAVNVTPSSVECDRDDRDKYTTL